MNMERLEKINETLNLALIWIAGFFMAAMIFLTCANIALRLVWVPISGTYELMGYCGALVTAFALGYTQIKKGHVAVDVLVHRFSRRTKKILEAVNNFILMIFFSVVAWQIAKYGIVLWKTGEVTETLRIVYYPFAFAVAFGCLTLVLAFVVQLLTTVLPEKESKL
jgi:TRAP-type C4-dicarboxylate transport system permease small subunit